MIFENFTCFMLNNNDDGKGVAGNNAAAAKLGPSAAAFMENLSCQLNKYSKRKTLQMEMRFKQQINQFFLNISITMTRPAEAAEQEQQQLATQANTNSNKETTLAAQNVNSNRFVLLNLSDINACEFLNSKNQLPLMYLARTTLNSYSNLPAQCPLKPTVSYYLRNYKWDMQLLPAFYIESPLVEIQFSYRFPEFQNATIKGYIFGQLLLKSNKKSNFYY